MESSSLANAHVPSAAKQIAAKIPTVKSRPSRPMFQTRFSRYHSSSPAYASRNRLLFRVPDSIAKRHPSKLSPDRGHQTSPRQPSGLATRETAGRPACSETDADWSRHFPLWMHSSVRDSQRVSGVNSAFALDQVQLAIEPNLSLKQTPLN